MYGYIERQHRRTEGAQGRDGIPYFFPPHAELAPGDIGELVETLHADHWTVLKQGLRCGSSLIGREGIDQNVAVQETDRHRTHRALSSSQSNFQSAGRPLLRDLMRLSARSLVRYRSVSQSRSP